MKLDTNSTGICTPTTSKKAVAYYTVDGRNTSRPQRGLNIVRMSDGTTKKVIRK